MSRAPPPVQLARSVSGRLLLTVYLMGRLLLQPSEGVTRSPGFNTTGTSHSCSPRGRKAMQ